MALTVDRTLAGREWNARPDTVVSALAAGRIGRVRLLDADPVSGGCAISFSTFGAWPAIPFSGAELLAPWLALAYLGRRAADEEDPQR